MRQRRLRSSSHPLARSFRRSHPGLERNCGASDLLSESENICPTCNGRKLTFEQVSIDGRIEVPCQSCGGTGLLSDAVVNTLTEENRKLEKANKELAIRNKNRIW